MNRDRTGEREGADGTGRDRKGQGGAPRDGTGRGGAGRRGSLDITVDAK